MSKIYCFSAMYNSTECVLERKTDNIDNIKVQRITSVEKIINTPLIPIICR